MAGARAYTIQATPRSCRAGGALGKWTGGLMGSRGTAPPRRELLPPPPPSPQSAECR